jgi:mono/diheme cytochrome c family protein
MALRESKGRTLLAAIAAAASVSGCHSGQSLTPQQAEGKHLYQIRCAHCHEDNDLGLKKIPPGLHGVFTHSVLPSGAQASDAEVARVVFGGKGLMPSFAGRFTQEQMSALLAYLHTGLR